MRWTVNRSHFQSFYRYCFVPAVFFFSTAMDGGGSKQYHVLSSAKHDLKSVQGRTDLR